MPLAYPIEGKREAQHDVVGVLWGLVVVHKRRR